MKTESVAVILTAKPVFWKALSTAFQALNEWLIARDVNRWKAIYGFVDGSKTWVDPVDQSLGTLVKFP